MLHPTTWKEALGKACSSLLEGDWVDSEILGLAGQWNKLWPHPKQAVAQALSLAEIHGAIFPYRFWKKKGFREAYAGELQPFNFEKYWDNGQYCSRFGVPSFRGK